MTEAQIQQQILVAFGARPNVRLWRYNTGKVEVKGRWIQFGINGAPDLQGILTLPNGTGAWLGVEVKSAKGKQSDRQQAFDKMVRQFGGCYILARDVDTVEKGIAIYLAERT